MNKTNLPKTIKKVTYQLGKTNVVIDRTIEAMTPGKRLSKSGKTYWEYRKNRSDMVPVKKL